MAKKKFVYSDYKPTQITTKRANKIVKDLYELNQKAKVCLNCEKITKNFNKEKACFVCANETCKNPQVILDPLHGWNFNASKLQSFLEMIIDMQNLYEMYNKLKISKPVLKKWRNRFIEQIDWKKYKLDRDVLDIREVYGNVSWTWN